MKTINLKRMMLIAVFIIATAGTSFAQQGRNTGKMNNCILELTEVQKTKMSKIRTANQKVMLNLRNQLNEKQAHLRTISTGDKVDMTKVNKTIEEIGAIKTSIEKNRAATQQKIRKLLTEEQRIKFDLHHSKRGKHNKHKGMKGHCRGSGYHGR